ncbi:MAG TPA: NAD-dependent epimerase/dehydratase family protein [Solirubrobacterales bacterium]|nr:NAD-dependent epimerase/dehydratase family protein [Solirubrobacterales bacterium]
MTIAVVGGTGTLGSLVVADLLGRGERVAVLSRHAEGVPAGAEHRRVDLTDGELLAQSEQLLIVPREAMSHD